MHQQQDQTAEKGATEIDGDRTPGQNFAAECAGKFHGQITAQSSQSPCHHKGCKEFTGMKICHRFLR